LRFGEEKEGLGLGVDESSSSFFVRLAVEFPGSGEGGSDASAMWPGGRKLPDESGDMKEGR